MARVSTAEARLPSLPDDAVLQLLVAGAPKVRRASSHRSHRLAVP